MTTFCNGLIENQPECEGLLLNYIEMLANLQQFEYEKRWDQGGGNKEANFEEARAS